MRYEVINPAVVKAIVLQRAVIAGSGGVGFLARVVALLSKQKPEDDVMEQKASQRYLFKSLS